MRSITSLRLIDAQKSAVWKSRPNIENSDMKQCYRFLYSCQYRCLQDTELLSCTDFLRMKYLDTTYFNTV